MITSQNHGFAVDAANAACHVRVTRVSIRWQRCGGGAQGCVCVFLSGHLKPVQGRSAPVRPIYFADGGEGLRPRRRCEMRAFYGHPHPGEEPCPNVQTSKTILIIGAGPIVIGQACEFDYSGAQACKALRE